MLWIVAVPTEDTQTATEQRLRSHTEGKRLCVCHPFQVPALKVGTLDALMVLSDRLVNADSEGEQLVKRIQKSFDDLQADEGADTDAPLLVFDTLPMHYIKSFQWDESRFHKETKLLDIVDSITKTCTQYSDDLKKFWTKYTETKTALAAIKRKQQGSLLLRPLAGLIDPEDIVEGSFISSAFIVIPLNREKEFLNTYEILPSQIDPTDLNCGETTAIKLVQSGIVVPGSAKRIVQDKEFVLYCIVVMTDALEAVRNVYRLHKYTLRHFEYDPDELRQQEAKAEALDHERGKRWRKLVHQCQVAYSEVFCAWMHLKVVRIFVESVLRYGLPVNFTSVLLEVREGKEKALRIELQNLYSHLVGATLATSDGTEQDIAVQGDDFFPYVFAEIDPFSK